MSNKYWTDKVNGVDPINAEDFNEAFSLLAKDVDSKAAEQHTHLYAGSGTAGGAALEALHALAADSADSAADSDHATTADSATEADYADTADNAGRFSVARKISGVSFDGTEDITVYDPHIAPTATATLNAARWYRIAEKTRANSEGSAILFLNRRYNKDNGENYVFAFAQGHKHCALNTLSCDVAKQLFTKLRYVYKNDDEACYLDVYYNGYRPNISFTACLSNDGAYKSTAFTPVEVPDGYSVKEFHIPTESETFTASDKAALSGKADAAGVFDYAPFTWMDFTYNADEGAGAEVEADSITAASSDPITIHCAGETLGFTATASGGSWCDLKINGQIVMHSNGDQSGTTLSYTLPPTYMESDIVIELSANTMYFSDMVRRVGKWHAELVGTSHTVIGDGNFAAGSDCGVGSNAFEIAGYSGVIGGTGTYTLGNATQALCDGIAVGDKYCIRMGGNFDCWGKVTAKAFNAATGVLTLTVNNFFTNEKNIASGTSTAYSASKTYAAAGSHAYAPEMGYAINHGSVFLYIAEKPALGTVKLHDHATAFGYKCYAQGSYSFAAGQNCWAAKYASVFGKNVKGGYGDFCAGRDVDLSFAQTSVAIGDDLKVDNFAADCALFGRGLRSSTSFQAIFGAFNKPNSNHVFQIGGGSYDGNRKNIFAIDKQSRMYVGDTVAVGSKMFDSVDTTNMPVAVNLVSDADVSSTMSNDTKVYMVAYNKSSPMVQSGYCHYVEVNCSKISGMTVGKYYVLCLDLRVDSLTGGYGISSLHGTAMGFGGTILGLRQCSERLSADYPITNIRYVFKYEDGYPIQGFYCDPKQTASSIGIVATGLKIYELCRIPDGLNSASTFTSSRVPVYQESCRSGNGNSRCVFPDTDGTGVYDVYGAPYIVHTKQMDKYPVNLWAAAPEAWEQQILRRRLSSLGKVDAALDAILAIQDAVIGGETA